MQRTNIRAVFIITAWFFAGGVVTTLWSDPLLAPSPQATPIPTPSVPPIPTPPPISAVRPTATFTFGDGTQITTQSTTGRFRLVGLHLNEVVDIALRFPVVLLSSSATAQSLDGGSVISFSISSGGIAGLASIRFQAGAQPGLYRIRVPGLTGSPLIQFWVADPNNPNANRPVLNPGH